MLYLCDNQYSKQKLRQLTILRFIMCISVQPNLINDSKFTFSQGYLFKGDSAGLHLQNPIF